MRTTFARRDRWLALVVLVVLVVSANIQAYLHDAGVHLSSWALVYWDVGGKLQYLGQPPPEALGLTKRFPGREYGGGLWTEQAVEVSTTGAPEQPNAMRWSARVNEWVFSGSEPSPLWLTPVVPRGWLAVPERFEIPEGGNLWEPLSLDLRVLKIDPNGDTGS
jgi:hypothetical protein